jgi:hypothetical protein
MNRAAAFAFKNFPLVFITLLTFASLSFGQPKVILSPKTGPPTIETSASGSASHRMPKLDTYFNAAFPTTRKIRTSTRSA